MVVGTLEQKANIKIPNFENWKRYEELPNSLDVIQAKRIFIELFPDFQDFAVRKNIDFGNKVPIVHVVDEEQERGYVLVLGNREDLMDKEKERYFFYAKNKATIIFQESSREDVRGFSWRAA